VRRPAWLNASVHHHIRKRDNLANQSINLQFYIAHNIHKIDSEVLRKLNIPGTKLTVRSIGRFAMKPWRSSKQNTASTWTVVIEISKPTLKRFIGSTYLNELTQLMSKLWSVVKRLWLVMPTYLTVPIIILHLDSLLKTKFHFKPRQMYLQ